MTQPTVDYARPAPRPPMVQVLPVTREGVPARNMSEAAAYRVYLRAPGSLTPVDSVEYVKFSEARFAAKECARRRECPVAVTPFLPVNGLGPRAGGIHRRKR